jgi:hypothetical protein
LDALDVKAAQLQSHEADFHRALPVILTWPLNQKQIESENTRVDFWNGSFVSQNRLKNNWWILTSLFDKSEPRSHSAKPCKPS